MWIEVVSGPDAGMTVRIDAEPFLIGRSSDAKLRLSDQKVSRVHAAIRTSDERGLLVEDLGSENGTLVHGREISDPAVVSDGTEVRVGDTVLRFTTDTPGLRLPVPPASDRRGGLVVAVALVAAVSMVAVIFLVLRNGDATTGGTTTSTTPSTTTTTTTTTMAPSIADVVEEARASTLKILTIDAAGQPLGSGTGWVYDTARNLVATNNHVINGGSSFELSGDNTMRQGVLVAAAPCEDLALLDIGDMSGLEAFTLGSQADLREGEEVVALGFPGDASLEQPLVATAGVVSVVQSSLNQPDLFDVPFLPNVIRTDAAINPGNSGGPLLTLDMRLVGVNTAVFSERGGRPLQNENYAIGVDRVADILETLASGNSLGWTGMDLGTLFSQDGEPFLVSFGVIDGSPAAAAGLPSQLLVIDAIDETPMNGTLQAYCDVVGGFTTGDAATFRVIDPDSGVTSEFELPFG